MRPTYIPAAMAAFITAAAALPVACDHPNPPTRTGESAAALEEGVSHQGYESYLFTDPEVRLAVEDYLDVMTRISTLEEQATALAAVAALDDSLRTEQLVQAFEEADLFRKWGMVFVMSKVPSEGGLAFAADFLTSTVVDEYDAYLQEGTPDGHNHVLQAALKIVVVAVLLVGNCHEAGIGGAGDLMVSIAVDHPISEVRHLAIRQVEASGSAALKGELRAQIRTEDEPWLNPLPFPQGQTFELDPSDPVFENPETTVH